MNFARMLKAMAVVGLVSFGSHVLADVVVVGEDDFEGYDEGAFRAQLLELEETDWTADAADLSEIKSGLVSDFAANGTLIAGDGTESQYLSLNTENKDLTFDAQTAQYSTVLVETLVQMVGSDTVPEAAALVDVQTAVYLDTTDPEDPVLKAYVQTVSGENPENGWVALTATVATNQWISLKIEVDYINALVDGTPNVYFYVNGVLASPTGGSALLLANNALAWSLKSISEVAFRGTGMVDNFKVSEEAQSLGSATIIQRSVNQLGAVIGETPTTNLYNFGDSLLYGFDAEVLPEYDLDKVQLLDADLNVVSNLALNGTIDVDEPTFEDGETYYLQATYKQKTFTVTVNIDYTDADDVVGDVEVVSYGGSYGPVDFSSFFDVWASGSDTLFTEYEDPIVSFGSVTQNITVTLVGTKDPVDPITITDNGTLMFGAIVFGSPTNTVSFTAQGTVSSSPATMNLIASTNLVLGAAGEFPIEVTVRATAGEPPAISGTVEIDPADLTGYKTFFIKGLGTIPAP